MAASTTPLYWCLLILGVLQVTKAANLIYYNGSLDNYVTTPIDKPLQILGNIDKSKKTVIYAFGFDNTKDSDSSRTILSAYLEEGNHNVILLDWSEEAKSYLAKIDYGINVIKARKVGSDCGEALVALIKNGVSPRSFHLVGHSLGAHVVGWAGEKVQKSNYNISRITGLDPAGPLFGCPIGFDGLRPFQAEFVDALHTNPGQLGTDESVGVVDLWANCGDYQQPGCKNNTDNISKEIADLIKAASCNHAYAWRLYAVAIKLPNAFQGAKASSCGDWKKEDTTTPVNYLGSRVITSLPGNFYFSTNPDYPYAKGEEGLRPNKK